MNTWLRSLRARFSHDTETRRGRFWSHLYVAVFDHAVLRMLWHNHSRVSVGIYRSNHPNRRRLARYARNGIRHVINLRGESESALYKFEAETCAEIGLQLHSLQMSARRLPERAIVLDLLDLLDRLDAPALIHCKSGADRTGLASAIVQVHRDGRSSREARRQLAWWRLHFKWTKAGVLDLLLVDFARNGEGEISFRHWVETRYDNQALMREFKRLDLKQRLAL